MAVVGEGDPRDPSDWSGTPAGIARGLRDLGVDTVLIAGGLRGRPRRVTVSALAGWRRAFRQAPTWQDAHRLADLSPARGVVTEVVAAAGLAAAGRVDAVIQIGTSYRVRHRRVITFEDMTVLQAVQHRPELWGGMPHSEVRTRVARQSAAYAGARACCVATPWARRSLLEEYAVPADKVRAVGLGRNREPENFARDWSVPRFLFVGRDWRGKNGEGVVRAFRRLHRDRPDSQLDVVGDHPPLDEPGVTGHGPLSLADPDAQARLARLYASATCLVVPSLFDAAGMVYLEAAASCLPAIGTARGGASDLIGPGGVVVEPTDESALVAALERFADPATARAVGAAARERADQFTWPLVARRLLDAAGLSDGDEAPLPWA